MRYLVLILSIVCLVRCSNTANATPTPENMSCSYVGGTNLFELHRCENNQVICMTTGEGGISCKWK